MSKHYKTVNITNSLNFDVAISAKRLDKSGSHGMILLKGAVTEFTFESNELEISPSFMGSHNMSQSISVAEYEALRVERNHYREVANFLFQKISKLNA